MTVMDHHSSTYFNINSKNELLNLKGFIVFAIFLLCLAPISIESSQGEGISANYLFAILAPLAAGLKFKKNDKSFLIVLIFCALYLISIPINIFYLGLTFDHVIRQSSSLAVFLLPFVLFAFLAFL